MNFIVLLKYVEQIGVWDQMACEMIRRVRSVIGVWDQRRVIFSNCFFRSETAKQAQRRTAQFPFMHGRLRPIVVSDPWRSRADVPSCGVSPWGIAADGRELAAPGCSRLSASEDKTLKLWRVSNGHLLRSFVGHADCIWCCSFTPDGLSVWSGSSDKTIEVVVSPAILYWRSCE